MNFLFQAMSQTAYAKSPVFSEGTIAGVGGQFASFALLNCPACEVRRLTLARFIHNHRLFI
jgi:hypothetical protein